MSLQIADKFQLTSLRDRRWQIQPCCALKGEGIQVSGCMRSVDNQRLVLGFNYSLWSSLYCDCDRVLIPLSIVFIPAGGHGLDG